VTGLASFAFTDRFRLVSIHPGHDLAELRAATGFEFDGPPEPPMTTAPLASELALIRGRIREEVAETYPVFAAGLEATARSAAP
jgi:Acyl CoA:acetate/3-ketoacid CoA transferase, beta subunit